MATIEVRGLGQVMILASDVERTARFYKDVLGFSEASEQLLSPGVTLEAGDASIYISDGGETAEPATAAGPGFRVALMVSRAREAYEQAKAAGVPIAADYDGNEHFASFSIADPDGIAIDIWGRP